MCVPWSPTINGGIVDRFANFVNAESSGNLVFVSLSNLNPDDFLIPISGHLGVDRRMFWLLIGDVPARTSNNWRPLKLLPDLLSVWL